MAILNSMSRTASIPTEREKKPWRGTGKGLSAIAGDRRDKEYGLSRPAIEIVCSG